MAVKGQPASSIQETASCDYETGEKIHEKFIKREIPRGVYPERSEGPE
jgi:hypothetical protein